MDNPQQMKVMKYAIVLIALGVAASCIAAEAAETVQTTNQPAMSQTNSSIVSVRYMIDDVDAAVASYTNQTAIRRTNLLRRRSLNRHPQCSRSSGHRS